MTSGPPPGPSAPPAAPAAASVDVLVLGGGSAGTSAALLLARAGMRTTLLWHGPSALEPVERVDNYLGFVEGVGGADLVRLGRDHAAKWGARLVEAAAESVARAGDAFVVRWNAVEHRFARLVLASNKSLAFAEQLGLALRTEPWARMKRRFVKVDEWGRTSVPGCYAAGRITGAPSQAITAAGDGARVAVTLVMDVRGKPYHDHSPYRPGARE